MSKIAVIGGTGLTQLDTLEIVRREVVHTPYGEPSGVVVHGELAGQEVVFLARHGHGHTIPPHRINYRANLYALYQIGVKKIIAVAAVGGINDLRPGQIAFPDQIIDYTYSREQTFFADINVPVTHIDFTHPYCPELRQLMIRAATELGIDFIPGGVYGATQGPRLETAAEIRRMRQDGCDYVGMTGMPEASLARELGLAYATCAVSANWAAGVNDEPITMDVIQNNLDQGMLAVKKVLQKVMALMSHGQN